MNSLSMAFAAMLAATTAASAHDDHHAFAAGQPGDPAAPSRTIDLAIHEAGDGTMNFGAADLRIARGEQIRFVVANDGKARHEFRLDDAAGNAAHKAMMAQMPDMMHHDPNAITIAPGKTATLVWRFSKPGTYEYACLIPGHYEAGMHGRITVAK